MRAKRHVGNRMDMGEMKLMLIEECFARMITSLNIQGGDTNLVNIREKPSKKQGA